MDSTLALFLGVVVGWALARDVPARLAGRLGCVLVGHRWRTLRVNAERASMLMHLHPEAGRREVCERCGERWDDA